MSLTIDTKEVLQQLNEMGYRNISSEQLKEFIKDLRKLIKYEERIGVTHSSHKTVERSTPKRFDDLHKAVTLSFQAKTKLKNNQNQMLLENRKTTAKSADQPKAKSISPPQNVIKEKRVKEIMEKENIRQPPKEKKSTRMWIRPKLSRTGSSIGKPNDPVHLYQFYKDEWEKFKQNLPGENNHAELRWSIRQKLLGA